VLRMLVAPVVVASTLALFATGVALLVADQRHGPIVTLHKASFVVWLGAMALHVLAHVLKLPRLLRRRLPGLGSRLALAGCAVLAGGLLATVTLPAADRLQDRASAHIGLDAR